MAEAKAVGFLELNIKGFEEAISSAKKLLLGLGGAFAAIKTVEFWKDGIEDAIKFGDAVYHASKRLGDFDPGNLLIAQKALENTGESADSALAIIDSALHEGRQLSEVFNGTQNYAKALQFAANSYGKEAEELTKHSKDLRVIWVLIQSVVDKVKQFFVGLASEFVKPLAAALKALDSIDLVGVGESFGKYLTYAAEVLIGAFKSGTLWDLVKTGMKLAFDDALDFLANRLPKIMQNAGDFLMKAFRPVIALLQTAIEDGINKLLAAIPYTEQNLKANDAAKRLTELQFKKADAVDVRHEWIQEGNMKLADKMNPIIDSLDVQIDEAKRKATGGIDTKQRYGEISDELLKFTDALAGGKPFEKSKNLQEQFDKLTKDAQKLGESFLGTIPTVPDKNEEIKGDPAHIIADSFAKVGGGGRYIRAGQTVAEKQLVMQTRAAKASEEIAKSTQKISENTAKNATGFALTSY